MVWIWAMREGRVYIDIFGARIKGKRLIYNQIINYWIPYVCGMELDLISVEDT